MLVDNSIYRNAYVANGSSKSFAISFPFLTAEHIQVFRGVDDENDMLIPASEYTISGAGNENGGTLVMNTTPASGTRIVILRNVPITQLYAYEELDNFSAKSHEDALAKLTMIDQQQQEQIDRAVKVPVTDERTPEQYAQELMEGKYEAQRWAEYAKAQADRTVQIPSETEVLASGTTSARPLADRFADVINVRDFGAKGDGKSDDTEAFEAAAATGRTVFVPEGKYVVTRKVDGVFISSEKAVTPHIDTRNLLAPPSLNPWVANFQPLDVGGDIPTFDTFPDDNQRWARAIQAPCVDPFDNILYVTTDPYVTTSANAHKTQMVAMKWGENTEDRTLVGMSVPAWGTFNHGSNFIWRPSKAHEPLIASVEAAYDASGNELTPRRHVRLIHWDCHNPAVPPQDVRKIRLFRDDETTGNINGFCLSYDQRKVIASATTLEGVKFFRVWDADVVFGQTVWDDVSDKYERQFEAPEGAYGAGQGIYSDGYFIYLLSGSEQFYIQVMTLDGKIAFNRPTQSLGREAYIADNYKVTSEPEGIFWAPYNGKIEMFAGMILNIYPTDDSYYYRRARYVALSIPNNPVPAGLLSVYKTTDDLDSVLDEGWYEYAASANSAPSGVAGYAHNIVDINGPGHLLQVAYGKSFTGAVFIRSYNKKSGWGAWYRNVQCDITKENTVPLSLTLAPDTRSYSSTSSNVSMCLRLRNNKEPNTDANGNAVWTGCYFQKYRNNSNAAGGSSMVSHNLSIMFTESGRSGAGFTFSGYFKEGVDASGKYVTNLNNGYFSCSEDNAASLGQSSNRWSQVYAATGSIDTSDAREKTNIDAPDEALMRAWGKVNFKSFQFADAVEKKGEDARIHFGIVAQQVAEAFASEGLDASRYALFCYDKWEDQYEDVEIIDEEAVLDNNGHEVTPAVTHVEKRLITPAGDRYGIRYSEALAIECAYQRWRLDKLEAKLNTGSTGYSVLI